MNVLESILGVFLGVSEWISQTVLSLVPMFWASETGLTFLGVLAVAGLAISITFLLIGLIQNFLHFKG